MPNPIPEALKNFETELRALLQKHRCTLTVDNHWTGYPECGQDLRLTADIDTRWDENGDLISLGGTLNLGTHVGFDVNMPLKEDEDHASWRACRMRRMISLEQVAAMFKPKKS